MDAGTRHSLSRLSFLPMTLIKFFFPFHDRHNLDSIRFRSQMGVFVVVTGWKFVSFALRSPNVTSLHVRTKCLIGLILYLDIFLSVRKGGLFAVGFFSSNRIFYFILSTPSHFTAMPSHKELQSIELKTMSKSPFPWCWRQALAHLAGEVIFYCIRF